MTLPRRFLATALLAALASSAVTAAALIGASAAVAAPSGPVLAPHFAWSNQVSASPHRCAVDVTRFRHVNRERGDDTPAFARAIAAARAHHPFCFRHGPSGKPQAVIYVPPGVYRLQRLQVPSNVRIEVSAAATLQQPANRPAKSSGHAISMITWDSPRRDRPVTNVSITGVGSRMDGRKRAALATDGKPLAAFELAHDFTMNLDPASTGSTNYNQGIVMINVQHFLVQNVFSIQNNRNQATSNVTRWPTSARAVLELHARNNSPKGSAANYMQPKYGLIQNHVNINGPRGFGPNQVNAATSVVFRNIYSRGGTALRIETDGSLGPHGTSKYGARVDRVYGRNIVGVNCNRAVSFSPHGQKNGLVSVSHVWAYSCYQGVIARLNKDVPRAKAGSFTSASVTGLQVVSGMHAQIDATSTLWHVGRSVQPVFISRHLPWTAHISLSRVSGRFASTG